MFSYVPPQQSKPGVQSELKVEGVRQYLRGDNQDKDRMLQYFHRGVSLPVGDALATIYLKWSQDLTIQGQLSDCFLRFQGDNLEDESVYKLAAIASHPEPIPYEYLICALLQKLTAKKSTSQDSFLMHRLSPLDIDEVVAGFRTSPLNSTPVVPRTFFQQIPQNPDPRHSGFGAGYGQSPAQQHLGQQGQPMPNINNSLPDYVRQGLPAFNQAYQSGPGYPSQPNSHAATIWPDLSQRIDQKLEILDRNIKASYNQLGHDTMERLRNTLNQETIDTIKPVLKQEIMQELEEVIKQRVTGVVQNERQSKLKKETIERLKHELKTDLVDQINQAVKREVLANLQRDLEPSFKEELLQLLRANISEEVISRLSNQNNNANLSPPSKQAPDASKLEGLPPNKRGAPEADMRHGQPEKKVRFEKDAKTTESIQHTSPGRKSGESSRADEKRFPLHRFESRNTIHEAVHLSLILNPVNKTLELRIIDRECQLLAKLTQLLKDAKITHSGVWLIIGDKINDKTIWIKFHSSEAESEPAFRFAEALLKAGLVEKINKTDSIDALHREWIRFLNSRSDSCASHNRNFHKTHRIKSLHTGTEAFTGNDIKLTLSLCSKLLEVSVTRLRYRLDTLVGSAISCRYSSKWICLDVNNPVRHMVWIEIDSPWTTLIRDIEGVAKIKAEGDVTTDMDEQFRSWQEGNVG